MKRDSLYGILFCIVTLSLVGSVFFVWKSGQDFSQEIVSKYELGAALSELNIDENHIVIDFSYSEGSGAPLILGIRGYGLPSRPLEKGERLVIVGGPTDYAVFLYFCADSRLCFVELQGS